MVRAERATGCVFTQRAKNACILVRVLSAGRACVSCVGFCIQCCSFADSVPAICKKLGVPEELKHPAFPDLIELLGGIFSVHHEYIIS